MPEFDLKAFEELLDVKLDQKFDQKLEPIKKILDSHTNSLDMLLTNRKTAEDEKIVSAARIDRLESWAKEAGHKLGLNIDL